MEYENMYCMIKWYIDNQKDFFIGGRGIGIECRKMDSCWKIEIERARFVSFSDAIVCENDKLKLYNECSHDWFAEFDLKHYLKVKEI